MKKLIAVLLSGILMISQSAVIFAAEDTNCTQEYEMIENEEWVQEDKAVESSIIAPYTLYIADIITSIVQISSTQVSIRAQTVCSEKVKSIKVTYTLQKWNGTKWVDVASKTATAYDASTAHKSYTISGLGSGSYRCKASATATGYNGYAESLAGYSAGINI